MSALAHTFDYSGVPDAHREDVRRAAANIHGRLHRAAEDIVEIGKSLIAVKELLGHGNFLPWIDAEFGMTDRAARSFMHVAQKFGKSEMISDFTATALYALAAPSTPDEVIEKVKERVASGERVTATDVRKMKADFIAERDKLKGEIKDLKSRVEERDGWAKTVEHDLRKAITERDDLQWERDQLTAEAEANTGEITATVVSEACSPEQEARPIIAAIDALSADARALVCEHLMRCPS
ncbi:MAG: DUF3102 domain-containing protein [Pseudomonadota bacterium]